jgi:hypothetical protein
VNVTVKGADRFQRTAGRAARDLRDLTGVHRRVADRVRAAADPPRRTGALAASLVASATATEATVSSSLVYAPVIEHGWAGHGIEPARFLTRALEQTRTGTLDLYAAEANRAVASIKGT